MGIIEVVHEVASTVSSLYRIYLAGCRSMPQEAEKVLWDLSARAQNYIPQRGEGPGFASYGACQGKIGNTIQQRPPVGG